MYFISWDVLGARKEDVPVVEASTTSVDQNSNDVQIVEAEAIVDH